MAEQEQVAGIGLGLSLDTAGFSAGIARAKAELSGLEGTPVRVRAEVAVPREAIKVPVTPVFGVGREELAGFRAQIEQGLKSANAQIPISIKLARVNYTALREEIAAGIGTVPIKVAVSGKSSPTSLIAATVAESQDESAASATSFVTNAARKRGLEPRRMGGSVMPGGRYLVGEDGPEELQMHARGGYIRPMRQSRAAGGRVPIEDLRRIARNYTRSIGRPDPVEGVYHPLDPDFSRRTARAYEAMPTQADAASRRSYRAFVDETVDQWRMLRANGYGMTPQKIDPYAPTGGKTKMQLAAQDVRRNKNLNVFASYLEHPMMSPREQLIFRHVHDLFGHLAEGNSIGPRGEFNAAIQHSQMYSPVARRAMLAETHGQNSVVNFSDTIPPGRLRTIAEINAESPGSIYAEQKARNLPEEILREFYAKAGIKRAGGGPVKRRYIVKDPDGIHGRPSQYLAGLMEGLDVHIAARNLADRDHASFEGPGNRTLDWYYLNARKGHGIEVTATGGDARRAHARIKGILGFDPYADSNRPYNPADRKSGFADFDPNIGSAYRRQFHEMKKLETGGFAEGFFDIPMRAQSKTPRGEKVRSMTNEGMTMAEFLRTASPEDKDFVDNLERAHQRLQPHHVEGGNAWYRVAGEYGRRIADKYGVSHRTGVGVLAALSAGTEWEANKTKYEKILAAHAAGKPFPYSDAFDAHRKAKAILAGQDPSEAFASSPKVGQFFPGMMGDLSTLTIDRWALRTATRGKLSQIGSGPVRTKIEQAWRQVAEKYGMAPAVSQAALWLLEKEESSRAPGQGTMGFAGGGFAHASEASALKRLRDITSPSGTILPGFTDEAQQINLQVERMRMAGRSAVESPWVRRMREQGTVAKEFRARGGFTMRDGFAVARDPAAERRSHRAWLRQANQPRDAIGRYLSPYSQDAWYDREGYNDPSFISLLHHEPAPHRMRSEDEAHWMGMASGGRADADAFERDAMPDQSRRRARQWWASQRNFHQATEAGRRHWDSEYLKLGGTPPPWGDTSGFSDPSSSGSGGGIIAKLEAMAAQTTQSPNEAAIARAKLESLRNRGRAAGGAVGRYIVGERGPELFVPKRMESLIPQDVMARLPKRDNGGIVEIGKKPFSEWSPPEDGWVIPNHLRNRIPGRAPGGPVSPGQMGLGLDQVSIPNWEPGLSARYLGPGRAQPAAPVEVKLVGIDDKAAQVLGASGNTHGGTGNRYRFHDEEVEEPPRGVKYPVITGRIRRLTSDFVPPSERRQSADLLNEYMAGGPQLIQGRSSVRSALAGISSYVLGGRQASAEARHRAVVDIRNVSAIETRQQQVEEARQGIGERLDTARAKQRMLQQGPNESDKAYEKRVDKAAEVIGKLSASHAALTETEGKLVKQHKALTDIAEASAKAARPSTPNVLQNVASVALATTGYGLVTQGISAVTSAALPALQKMVDAMGGFKSSATATTSALADDTAARNGNAKAAIAGAAASAGLSEAALNFVDVALRPTVTAKAGGKAAGQASDLLRAVVGSAGGPPQGLYGGYGGIGGTAFLGEALGGGKGYTEQVAGDIAAFSKAQTPELTYKDNWMASGIPGVSQLGQLLGGRSQSQILGAATQAPDALAATIQNQNDAVQRGATYAVEATSNLKLVASRTDAEAKAFADLGASAGDADNAAKFAAAHVVLINQLTGKVVDNVKDYQKYWEQAATGASIANPATVMRQIAQQTKATFAGIDARVAQQLSVTLRAQTAFGLVSNPLVAAANILPTGGVGAAGVTGTAGGNIGASLALSNRAQGDIRSEAQAGLDAARAEVKSNSPQQLPLFNQELAKAQSYSTQIEATTNRITLEQANLSAHEFAQTMFYLNRQLSDAKGLAGEISGPNNLGSLQRSAFMIGRQQTSLGLDLQQRQITTNVALAGFQAPGESPEERYARREEAQIQARIQQRQLGLSRQAFGVEGQIFNVQAQRGVSDTQRSIGLTQEQRNVALDTAAANKAIDDAGRALAIHLQKAGTILDGAGQKVETKLGAAVDFAAQYGGTMEAATASLNKAMNELADPQTGLNATITRLLNQPQIPTTEQPSGTGRAGGGSYATGVLGTTAGPTHMYVGEAGRETVAILRNPRMAQMGLSGGGPHVTIMVTGNTFASPGDDRKLVQQIEAAVMSAMARKGQLLGLRGPSN